MTDSSGSASQPPADREMPKTRLQLQAGGFSLATKLAFVSTSIAMVAIVVVALAIFFSMKGMLEQDAARELNAEVSRQSDNLDAAIDRVRIDTHYISKLESVANLVSARTVGGGQSRPTLVADEWEERLVRELSSTLGSRGYRQVQLLDLGRDGREILGVRINSSTQRVEVTRRSKTDRELNVLCVEAGRSLERGEVYASPITFEQSDAHENSTGIPTQWLAAPIFLTADSAEARGADALLVVSTFMDPILDSTWNSHTSFDVILADQSGGYFHHPGSSLEWSYEPAGQSEPTPIFIQQLERAGGSFVLGGADQPAYATRRVSLNPGTDETYITVVLASNKEHLQAGIKSLMWRLLSFTLFALVFVSVACAFFLQKLTSPIRELSTAATRIANGGRGVEFPTTRGDELGLLSRSLSNLVAEFQMRTAMADHKTAQVKHLNETLETQVETRTSALVDSEARLTAIMNTTVDAFITVDQEGAVQYWNRAATKMFGLRAEAAFGRSFRQFVPRDDQEDRGRGFPDKVYTARSSHIKRAVEVEAVRADGTRFPVLMTINTAEIKDGVLVVAILRDLTEERALALQLDQARKLEAIGSLAAGVAHEINTPTQYVTDNVRFLEEGCHDLLEFATEVFSCIEACGADEVPDLESIEKRAEEADLKYLVEEMPRAIDESVQGLGSIAKIVKAMKEFSHPGSEAKTPIDIAHMIENTMTVGRHEWKYIADIELKIEPDLPMVPCIIGDLSQVILNLIVNAAHAIEERMNSEDAIDQQGKITISAAVVDSWVELRVADTGAGIPPEIVDRIFDPFFTTKDVGKGTGQGLAIARAIIVDRHLGEMSVESEVGTGTTFIIHLPFEESELPEVVS